MSNEELVRTIQETGSEDAYEELFRNLRPIIIHEAEMYDLGAGLAVFLPQLSEDRLFNQALVSVAQGIPCHESDAIGRQNLLQLRLRIVWMRFHLHSLGFDFRKVNGLLCDAQGVEVGNADRLDFSCLDCLFNIPVTRLLVIGGLV